MLTALIRWRTIARPVSRAFSVMLMNLVFACCVLAQETASERTEATDNLTQWKIINTVIFAIGLGWALWKYAPGFFNSRSADIQKAIKDATGLKIDADFRYSEIDRKMANLAAEKKRLEQEAEVELQREHERLQRETEAEIAHIRRNTEAELDALRAEGSQRIRRHTARLALDLAERRLQEQFASAGSGDLIEDFVHLVDRGKN